MRVWLYMAVGLALLAVATWRMVLHPHVGLDERLRCEAVLRTDHGGNPDALALLLPHCAERGMVTTMEVRREGAAPQEAEEVLNTAARLGTQSALINLALTLAGIGAFAAAWRLAHRRRHRF